MRKRVVPIAVAAALALACPIAGAQCRRDADCAADRICVKNGCTDPPPAPPPPGATAGRARLDLRLDLLGAAVAAGEGGAGLFNYNLGPVPILRFGLGAGYALTDRLSLGARLDLGLCTLRHSELIELEEHDPGAEITNTVVDLAVLPYLERAFGAERLRPYLSIGAGFASSLWRQKIEYRDDMDTVRQDETVVLAGVVGLGSGLRVPLAERVSLDLGLLLTLGVGRLTAAQIEDGPQHEAYGTEDVVFFTRADLFVGVTGWI